MYVNEIFTSISGEVGYIPQGTLVTFLRLQKCNLKCSYCDTPEAQKDWEETKAEYEMSNNEIIGILKDKRIKNVVVTGGEPLLQQNVLWDIFDTLDNYQFQIETNGTIRHYRRLNNISFVVDYKFEYEDQMNWEMFKSLTEKDFIKIVIANEEQYTKAKRLLKIFKVVCPDTKIAFSPVHGKFDNLADLIIKDKLDVIYNMQIHKFIGVK